MTAASSNRNCPALNVRFESDAEAGRELIRKARMYAARDGFSLKEFVVRALQTEIEKAERKK